MSDREEKIRAKAYEIWVAEGCPDGCAEQHWATAEAIVAEELVAEKPKRAPRKPRAAAEAEPAAEEPKKKARAAKPKAPKLKVVSDRGAA